MKLGKPLTYPLLEGATTMLNRQTIPVQTERDARRTVIPAPKSSAMFPGWGVKF